MGAAGAGLDNVVEVGVLLADPADFSGMNDEYGTWFPVSPRLATRQNSVPWFLESSSPFA
ncbi:RidA family protein [Paeniglutamicibacter cryotolerans]|uniref:RidA family protein n=1 Tax=Paeniglutamicibacter cryotolerans TaxID=670079 RepID=UPI001FE93D85|nr:hypothetical protein [Paeniglutamicibacter cryotolerans]